ncbi:hypothetical protein N480_03135 [Pseudoalteromonas luteoviolacea S2607]|uniref:hypothetical protein n=1 Tax=Pseudoalteromonas luteoviolacea TaxID=43657 RepID=UPI0007B0417D|nr:hypothetical protein [Pseudoalteromonas luteoviolacea]KZN30965.1 hypothetical protein N480_03135 [Pseudoalteromonas luteoviolacea S2607]
MRLILLAVSMAAINAQAAPCDDKQYREFDFWIGDWQVESNGKLAGTSKISKILDGCVLLEEYKTPTGYQGKSLNIFNKASGKWHQTWTDNTGLLLQLEGEFSKGRMTLRGETKESNGTIKKHEIIWEKTKQNTIHQHWRTSSNSQSWTTEFYGIYSQSQVRGSNIQSVTTDDKQKPLN